MRLSCSADPTYVCSQTQPREPKLSDQRRKIKLYVQVGAIKDQMIFKFDYRHNYADELLWGGEFAKVKG